jgi:hypothetical protein
LVDTLSLVECEAISLWNISVELQRIKRCYVRSGTGADELRDELDMIAELTESPAIATRARRLIADIDRQWPHMAVA